MNPLKDIKANRSFRLINYKISSWHIHGRPIEWKSTKKKEITNRASVIQFFVKDGLVNYTESEKTIDKGYIYANFTKNWCILNGVCSSLHQTKKA